MSGTLATVAESDQKENDGKMSIVYGRNEEMEVLLKPAVSSRVLHDAGLCWAFHHHDSSVEKCSLLRCDAFLRGTDATTRRITKSSRHKRPPMVRRPRFLLVPHNFCYCSSSIFITASLVITLATYTRTAFLLASLYCFISSST